MKFLQQLDLSCNQLRNLHKIKSMLAQFQKLELLNLMGNPCCEEADYRLTLIHAIPSLKVLDCHGVQPWEQMQVNAPS
jgi:Leucine-rich repeat (LRR) protein